MSDLKDVSKVMAYLATLYPHFQMSKDTPKAYLTILCDIPADVLQAAAMQVASSNTFFPSAAELRRAATGLLAKAHNELTAEEAWVVVARAISRWGSYGEPLGPDEGYGWRLPRELDAVTLRAIEGVGGWRSLCASEQQGVERAHFLRIYEALQRADRGDQMMLPEVRAVVNRLAAEAGKPMLAAPAELKELEY